MKRFLGNLLWASLVAWLGGQALMQLQADLPQANLWVLSAALGATVFLFLPLFKARRRTDSPLGQLLLLRSHHHPSVRGYLGVQQDFAQYLQPYQTEAEMIFAVAIRHPCGFIYAAEQPARHSHVIAMMSEHGSTAPKTRDQGFVTSWGRYVGRKEALVVAQAAGQLIRKTHPPTQLFSEDLWEGPLLSRIRLQERAQELVRMAHLSSAVVTIETRPRKDNLAMGSYDLLIQVREAWPLIRARMAEEEQSRLQDSKAG